MRDPIMEIILGADAWAKLLLARQAQWELEDALAAAYLSPSAEEQEETQRILEEE